MPTPATAPPRVMVFNCGTTVGMTPCARHSRTRSSYGIMPSASTQPEPPVSPNWMTWLKARTSRRRRSPAARSRKRLDVSLASATGPPAALSCAARASFFFACCCKLVVEELPAHGIARHRHVALGEDDLEEVRAPDARAEHLGAAVQIRSPD